MAIKSQTLCFDRTGSPADVLRLETRELPAPGPSQVIVRVLASPIHPADFNFIEGTYGVKAAPPQVAGLEGVGVIEKVGVAVPVNIRAGTMVIAPGKPGRWCERYLADTEELILLPPGLHPQQAGLCGINPPTAWRMLKDFVNLVPGDWVVQNAANSAVGRAVIQIARHRRLRTLNLVRRAALVPELTAAGGTAVIDTSEPSWFARAQAALGGTPPRLALNAVGGRAGADLAKLLAEGGTLVTYGAMGLEPFTLSNAQLIFRDIQARGFWVTRWMRKANRAERQELFAEIFGLLKNGVLSTPVEQVYPLSAYREALAHAARSGRAGKVLFAFE